MSSLKATELCRIPLQEDSRHDAVLLPDLDAIVTTTRTSLHLYSASQKHPTTLLKTDPARIGVRAVSRLGHRVAWSDGGRRMFTTTPGSSAPSVELTTVPHHLNCIVISGDERIVAVGGSALTRERMEYEADLRSYEAGMPYDYGENRPDIRPDPGFGPGHVRVWDPSTGRSTMLEGHRNIISRMALNHDGSMIAALDERAIRVWDVASTRCIVQTPKRGRFTPQAFLLAPAGDYLLTGDIGEIWLYDTSSTHAERVLTVDGNYNTCIGFDGTGRLSAVAYDRGVVSVYENLTGRELCSVPITETPHRVALSSKGRRLAVLTGTTLVIWQLEAIEV